MTKIMHTSTVFSGFSHTAQGDTYLTLKDESLQVSAGAKPLSLRIDTGVVKGIIPEIEIDPWQLADGASLTSVTIGKVDGKAEQQTGSLTFDQQGRGMFLEPDFSAIGAETYEVILFREGQVVWRQPGSSGVAGAFNNFTARRRRACCRIAFYSFGNTSVAPFTLTNGPQIDADNVFFVPERPKKKVNSINALTLAGKGIKSLTLASTSVAVIDPFVTYRGLQNSVLTVDNGSVLVELKRGCSGGVAVACGDVDRCQLNLRNEGYGSSDVGQILVSPGLGMFRSELEFHGKYTKNLDLNGISGPNAEIRLDLAEDSRISLSNERIETVKGASGTMREVQEELRKLET